MLEGVPFYALGETPADIVKKEGNYFGLYQYSWKAVREYAGKGKTKAYYIDLRSFIYLRQNNTNQIPMAEIPKEFLTMPDDCDTFHMYITSVNYKEAGPFHFSELAFRAYKRLFSWDMYVAPGIYFSHARDIPKIRKILEKYYPLQSGDTGPAGGVVIRTKEEKLLEVSPVDAGWCTWHDADRLCREFSHNGYGSWRLPSPEELKEYAYSLRSRLKNRENVYQTTETTMHWSSKQKDDKAFVIVTGENEDYYVHPYSLSYMSGTSGGYWTSSNGPHRGDQKEFRVTDWLPVRPVRDLNLNDGE